MVKKAVVTDVLPLYDIEQLPFEDAQKYLLEIKARYSTLSLIKYWGTNSKYIYGKIYKKYSIPTSGHAIKVKKQTVLQQENEILLQEFAANVPPVPAVEIPNKPRRRWEKSVKPEKDTVNEVMSKEIYKNDNSFASTVLLNNIKPNEGNKSFFYLDGKYTGEDLSNKLHLISEFLAPDDVYTIKISMRKRKPILKQTTRQTG